MADKKFYTVEEAAEILGLSPAEVSHMREENRLRGFRDGATWKFRVEDVDQLAKELNAPRDEPGEEEGGDLLLSEVELGGSDAGSSGTVIGDSGKPAAADSDIRLADSDVKLAGGSGLQPAGSGSGRGELDLTLDEDLSLEDSKPLSEQKGAASKAKKTAAAGDSTLDLSAPDDELVLGGSGSGSDITIGGDSGISLVDPADSGLSLEEPLELSPSASEESLELGEDDMLSLDEQAVDGESPTELKADDDFLLTPLEEVGEEEDSESGSQVIALDSEVTGEEAATMIATPAPGMAAMLDEDLGGGFGVGPGPGVGVGPGPTVGFPTSAPGIEGAPAMAGAAVLPETPYSGWVVTGLVICFVFLMLTGWMMFDLMRNMWSWGGTYSINSSLMDAILNLLPY